MLDWSDQEVSKSVLFCVCLYSLFSLKGERGESSVRSQQQVAPSPTSPPTIVYNCPPGAKGEIIIVCVLKTFLLGEKGVEGRVGIPGMWSIHPKIFFI